MPESLRMSVTIPASPTEIYEAFLDSRKHTAMTGARASIDPTVGGEFTAWDDYISGTTVALEPSHRITQRWRTTDFPTNASDSLLEIILEETHTGTKITLKHTNIPEGQAEQYRDGWREFYFEPMKRYFKKEQVGAKKAKTTGA